MCQRLSTISTRSYPISTSLVTASVKSIESPTFKASGSKSANDVRSGCIKDLIGATTTSSFWASLNLLSGCTSLLITPRLLVSGSRPPLQMPQLTAVFDEKFGGVEIKSVGSVGAKVVQILEGHADVYVHTTGFYEWDVAAPLGIAIAGGLAVL